MRILYALFLRIMMVSSILIVFLLGSVPAFGFTYPPGIEYGAEVLAEGATVIWPNPPLPSTWSASDGGDGVLTASASGGVASYSDGRGSANAALDTLQSYTHTVPYGWGSAVVQARVYDWFRIVSDTLPTGDPVIIYMDWRVTGSFLEGPWGPAGNPSSGRFDIVYQGTAPGDVRFLVQAYWGSTDTGTVDASGRVTMDWLKVGDRFRLDVSLGARSSNAFYDSSWEAAADFTSTCSLQSGTEGVSIIKKLPPPVLVPEFGMSTILITSIAAALYFLRSRPRRIVSQG